MRIETYNQKDKKKNIPAEGVVSMKVDGRDISKRDILIKDNKIIGCVLNNTFYYRFDSQQGKNSLVKVYYKN